MFDLDFTEIFARMFKYFLQGLSVAIAVFYIQKGSKIEDVIMVALVAAASMAIIDLYGGPTIATGFRLGLGGVAGAKVLL